MTSELDFDDLFDDDFAGFIPNIIAPEPVYQLQNESAPEGNVNDSPSTSTEETPNQSILAVKNDTHKRRRMFPIKNYRIIKSADDFPITSLSVDEKIFVVGSMDVKIYDILSGRLLTKYSNHKLQINDLFIHRSISYLFTASADTTIQCIDLTTNQVARTLRGHLSAVYSIKPITGHNELIVSGSRDASVRVWDIRDRSPVFTFGGHTDSVLSVLPINSTSSSEQNLIISGSSDTTIGIHDMIANKTISTLTHHKKPVKCLLYSNDSNRRITSIASDKAKSWNVTNSEGVLQYVGNLERHEQDSLFTCGAINDDGLSCLGTSNENIVFYDGQNFVGRASAEVSQSASNGINCCSFDLSGTRLITGDGNGVVKMWK
jgi:pleiotropic regulator 1